MDTIKPQNTRNQARTRTISIISVIGVIAALSVLAMTSLRSVSVSRSDILIATVEAGDLKVVVGGFGVLRSSRQQILSTLATATVQEIVLKPGASVKEGSVIARLSNPDLQREVEAAQQEVSLAEANLRQMRLNHTREMLDEEANLVDLESDYETARLRKEAEEQLVESGTVSELAFRESAARESQLRQRTATARERIAQLALVHKEALIAQQELVNQQNGKLDAARARVDSLTVTASFDGSLQRLPVELGQTVAAGEEVALVGSNTELLALVRVPQSQASLVGIGQDALVNIRSATIRGRVARVEPRVEENTVVVEISLVEDLPEDAIAEQSIDAEIIAESIPETRFIRRPANVRPNSEVTLYRLDTDASSAERTSVELGKESGRLIQIVSGAEQGERFIISDMSRFESQRITVN